MSATTPPADTTEALTTEDEQRLRAQLDLGRTARRAVAGVGVGCVVLGLAVGGLLLAAGERWGALVLPALMLPTGTLFFVLAQRARRTIEQDLAGGRVAVVEGRVEARRQMQLPRGQAHVVRVDGRDVFVSAAIFGRLAQGDRVRIRRAPHSGIALTTHQVRPDGSVVPLTGAPEESPDTD